MGKLNPGQSLQPSTHCRACATILPFETNRDINSFFHHIAKYMMAHIVEMPISKH